MIHLPPEIPEDTETEPSERQQRDESITCFFANALSLLLVKLQNQGLSSSNKKTISAFALALGLNHIAGGDNPTDCAKSCGVSKQDFGKTYNEIIEMLNLDKTRTQRSEESRENMRAARFRQLKK